MRKLVVLYSLFWFSLALTAANVNVKGSVEGKPELSNILINILNPQGRLQMVTTAAIKPDNTFGFNLDIEQTSIYVLTFQNLNKSVKRQLFMVLSPGDDIQLQLASTYTDLTIASFKGSKELEVISGFQKLQKTLSVDLKVIEKNYKLAATEADKSLVQATYFKRHAAYEKDLKQLLSSKLDLLSSALIAYSELGKSFVEHKDFFKLLYNQLVVTYPENSIVKDIGYKVKNPIKIGEVAPEIIISNPQGKEIKLSDLRGKYVLIDFWASWCGPCRRENPAIVALYKTYKEKGFDVFSISLDNNKQAWVSAISMDGLVWENHGSSLQKWTCPVAKSYRASSIPYAVLIDKEGKIIAEGLRAAELSRKLETIFSAK